MNRLATNRAKTMPRMPVAITTRNLVLTRLFMSRLPSAKWPVHNPHAPVPHSFQNPLEQRLKPPRADTGITGACVCPCAATPSIVSLIQFAPAAYPPHHANNYLTD